MIKYREKHSIFNFALKPGTPRSEQKRLCLTTRVGEGGTGRSPRKLEKAERVTWGCKLAVF